jgi:hypothetical protein
MLHFRKMRKRKNKIEKLCPNKVLAQTYGLLEGS